MSYQPIGDTVFFAKLAYDLYTKGWLVVKHAPEEFGELQGKLKFTRATLLWIENNLRRDENDLIEEALEQVNKVLRKHYAPIVEKFEKLSSTDQGIFFKRVQFATSRKEIEVCKTKLSEAQEQLRLALDAYQYEHVVDRRSADSTSTQEAQIQDAAENENILDSEAPVDAELPVQSFNRSQRNQSPGIAIQDFQTSAQNTEELEPLDRGRYGSPFSPFSRPVTIETYSTVESNVSNAEPSENLVRSHAGTTSETTSASRPHDTSAHTIISENEFLTNRNMFVIRQEDLSAISTGRELPANPSIERELERAANTLEMAVSLDSWLAFAFWWFLKSRYILDLFFPDRTTNSEDPIGSTYLTYSQSSLDLMKSEFILRRKVLEELSPGSEVTAVQWTAIQNLADGIRDAQEQREEGYGRLHAEHERKLDFALVEDLKQNVEYPVRLSDRITVPRAIDTLEPTEKWLKIEPSHAGAVHGELIYRGFVNASIGPTELMRKTRTAPYLLVLSSPGGSVEPVISLMNQSGTVKLSRRMTEDDIQANDSLLRTSETTLQFDFPSQNAVIDFLCGEELEKFLEKPRKFFAATQDRYPRDREFLVFREVADSFDDMMPDHFSRVRASDETTLKNDPESLEARRVRSPCEVSLYENIPNEDYWKQTRRLVICSSVNDSDPWSLSLWLPLSKVNIAFDTRDKSLTLIWSDFKNHSTRRSGNFWHYHSYNCNPDKPNREIRVRFQSSEAVEAFAEYILNPFDSPFEVDEYIVFLEKFDNTPENQHISVFEIHNPDSATAGYYRALVTIDRVPHSRLCVQVYFAARYLDYKLNELSVEICDLTVPHYVSNMQELEEPPDSGEGPQLARIESMAKTATFKFRKAADMFVFIGLLIPSWKCEWHGRANTLVLSKRFKRPQKLKEVDISLWKKVPDPDISADPLSIYMTARGTQNAGAFWVTAKIDRGSHFDAKDRKIVVIELVAAQYGTTVDTVEMGAANASRSQRYSNQSGKITLCFENDENARWFTGLTSLPIKWIPGPRSTVAAATELLSPAQLVGTRAVSGNTDQSAVEEGSSSNGGLRQSTDSQGLSRFFMRESATPFAPHTSGPQTQLVNARMRSEGVAPDSIPRNRSTCQTEDATTNSRPSVCRTADFQDNSQARHSNVVSTDNLAPFRTRGGMASSSTPQS